jgi:PAS domain-containing protein
LGEPNETKSRPAAVGNASFKPAPSILNVDDDRLRLALEGGGIGLWERDLQSDEVTWSTTLYELLGRDPKAPVTAETFFEYIHQNDRSRVRVHLEQWLEQGAEFKDEFWIVREDGELRCKM